MKKILLLLITMITISVAGVVYAGAMVNINTASVEQLQAVKGVGPKTAAAIVAFRSEHGEFKSVEALSGVKGIGEKKLEKIKGSLTVAKAKN